MKFDVVIGNPPYQENVSKSSGNKSLAKQLFPIFMIESTKISNRYVSLITPAKWFTSNGQDGSFKPLRKFAQENNHFKEMHYFSAKNKVFDNVEIGAVSYYIYDKDYQGDTLFVNNNNGYSDTMKRPLFEDNVDIVLSLNPMGSILKKVKNHSDFITLTEITTGRNAFNITGKEANNVSSEDFFENAYELRASYEKIRYISSEKITKNNDIADNWKIFISKANGAAGVLSGEEEVSILGKPYLGKPKSVCTDSLIPIGSFKTKVEAINLRKYLHTKFVRFMVGIMKTSQNITQIVYRFVPMQDFTFDSDLSWDKSVAEIDQQLYKKYDLNSDEINFIETNIKEMEWHADSEN